MAFDVGFPYVWGSVICDRMFSEGFAGELPIRGLCEIRMKGPLVQGEDHVSSLGHRCGPRKWPYLGSLRSKYTLPKRNLCLLGTARNV